MGRNSALENFQDNIKLLFSTLILLSLCRGVSPRKIFEHSVFLRCFTHYNNGKPWNWGVQMGLSALPTQMVNLRGPDLSESLFLKGQFLNLSVHTVWCSQQAVCSLWLSLPKHPSNISNNHIETDRKASGVYLNCRRAARGSSCNVCRGQCHVKLSVNLGISNKINSSAS